MKILVTGANGQLGREIALALQAEGNDCIGVGREEIDFSRPDSVGDAVTAYAPDWVINCAAYTNVDMAEENRTLAYTVNRDGARAVAEGVKHSGGRLLHISTDYIFGGDQSYPYREDDPAMPLSVYGRSKHDGELAIREVLPDAVILRTGWVYGIHGRNFVKTILLLAAQQQELRVVDDEIGTPTWAGDIVGAVRQLLVRKAEGIWHFTNEGVASRYDFAQEIVSYARAKNMPVACERLVPIPAEAFPRAARRPSYSVMSKEKIRGMLDCRIPYWRDSLHTMMNLMASSSFPVIPGAEGRVQ